MHGCAHVVHAMHDDDAPSGGVLRGAACKGWHGFAKIGKVERSWGFMWYLLSVQSRGNTYFREIIWFRHSVCMRCTGSHYTMACGLSACAALVAITLWHVVCPHALHW